MGRDFGGFVVSSLDPATCLVVDNTQSPWANAWFAWDLRACLLLGSDPVRPVWRADVSPLTSDEECARYAPPPGADCAAAKKSTRCGQSHAMFVRRSVQLTAHVTENTTSTGD